MPGRAGQNLQDHLELYVQNRPAPSRSHCKTNPRGETPTAMVINGLQWFLTQKGLGCDKSSRVWRLWPGPAQ
ncbi:hypothetical protein niasHT_009964 [Heterodera trifolii]|uniref:Choline dehydrogenase n=1 Tax=Heterodera trifolii TaxID=157864 RepID=A0ABD2M8B9_9BILA